MLASTWSDPVLGIDIHIILVPPLAVPTPLPLPFIGIVFDPIGLAAHIGISAVLSGGSGLVLVNSLPATNCGTEVKALPPHIPIPGPFAVPPANNAELYLGGLDVSFMGSYAVRRGDLAFSCSTPVRLPTSVVLAISKGAPVLVERSMAPDLLTLAFMLAFKGLFKAFKKLLPRRVAMSGHAFIRRFTKAGRLRNMLQRSWCKVTGHPVDVATGRMFTDDTDFELPGPIPLDLTRTYDTSFSHRDSVFGYGWNSPFEQSVWMERGKFVLLSEDGREIEFQLFDRPGFALDVGQEVYHPLECLTLRLVAHGYFSVTSTDGAVRHFAPVIGRDGGRAYITKEQSRSGHEVEYLYAKTGELEMIRDSAGRLIRFEYDRHGRVRSTMLPLPQGDGWYTHTSYVYSAEGDLVEVTNSIGSKTRYCYKNHLMVQETWRTGLNFYFVYDGADQNARCVRTWGDGGLYDHEITYDAPNRKTFVENSLGHVTVYEMNELGMVIAQTDALGKTVRYEYDPDCGLQTAVTNPLGQTTRSEYDVRANLTRAIGPDGAALVVRYNGENQPIEAEDPVGGRWRWVYGAQGELVEELAPEDLRTTYVYERGLLCEVHTALGATRLEYDTHKNVRTVTLPNGAKHEFKHDAHGRVTKQRDPRGGATHYRYDTEGHLLRVETPIGTVQQLEYDADGHLLRYHDAKRQVSFTYGNFKEGRLQVVERAEAGTRVCYDYNTEGDLVAVVNEASERYIYDLDACGRVRAETGFDGKQRRYFRDAAGRVVEVTDPEGQATKVTYDTSDRVKRLDYADGDFAEYSYRLDGALMCAKNQHAHVEFERDGLGRVVQERQASARRPNEPVGAQHSVVSCYGADGSRQSLGTSLGARSRVVRDALGLVEWMQFGGRSGPALSPLSGLGPTSPDESPSAPLGVGAGFGMDSGAYRAVAPLDFGPGPPRRAGQEQRWLPEFPELGSSEGFALSSLRVTRDAAGFERGITLPGQVAVAFERDIVGRRTSVAVTQRGSGAERALSTKEYTYRGERQIAAIADSWFGRTEYLHDQRERLVQSRSERRRGDGSRSEPPRSGPLRSAEGSVTNRDEADRIVVRALDDVGNVYQTSLLQTATFHTSANTVDLQTALAPGDRRYGKGGRLERLGDVAYTYNNNGQPLERRDAAGATWKYAWNSAGYLTQVDKPNGECITFSYDPFGRRVSKTRSQLNAAGEALDVERTEFIWDGNNLVHEISDRDGVTTWYWDPDTDAPVAKECGGRRYTIASDHLGVPTEMFDETGTLVWRCQLDVYGVPAIQASDNVTCPWRFPGQYADSETGLYYNRFRYYDPQAGRYLTQDPMGLAGGLEAYGYVPDPTTRMDPLGLMGAYKASVEATTLERLRSRLRGRTLRDSANPEVEWIDDLGRTYDHMGFPAMIPHWNAQRTNFFAQIRRHLVKADFTVVDLTDFPQHIRDEVGDFVLGLTEQQFEKIIPIGF